MSTSPNSSCVQTIIAEEDLAKTEQIAADMKDIKEMSEDLNKDVKADDDNLVLVNDNLQATKDHMDKGNDSLKMVSC